MLPTRLQFCGHVDTYSVFLSALGAMWRPQIRGGKKFVPSDSYLLATRARRGATRGTCADGAGNVSLRFGAVAHFRLPLRFSLFVFECPPVLFL